MMDSIDESLLFVNPSDKEEHKIYSEICMNKDELILKTNSMKEWIQSQPHLPQSLGEEDIKPFLIWAKGNLSECQKRLDSFYSMRTYRPNLFGPRDPMGNDFKNSFSCSNVVILPRQYKGCFVLMLKPTTEDPTQFTIEGLVQRVTLILELSMRVQPLSRGLCIIMDEKMTNVSYIPKLSPSVAKECLYCIQNALPIRLKQIVIINVNSLIRIILQTFVFPFLKKKIKERVCVHSEGSEVLENYFPREILPLDYGGEGKTLQQLDDDINNYLISKREYILKENSLKVDESLRIPEDTNTQDSSCSLM